MKGEQKQLLIIILLLFGLTGWSIGQEAQLIISIHSFNDSILLPYPNNHKITKTQILTSHDPIFIANNDQFTSEGFLGSGTSEDPYRIENLNITYPNDDLPLKNPYHLLAPIITNISAETLTLDGNVIIEWNVSKDTFGHSFTYAILYSPDNGQSWTTIASSLTTTNYTIDTTTITDGMHILLKVQAVDSIGFIAQTIYSETFLVLNALSPPIVVSPNGGETLNETVTIEWDAFLDPDDHSITYSVYYSSDNGITWTLLASDLTSTSYSWDTTSVPNGLSYLIKVTATCSGGVTREDISDSTFTIQNPAGVPGMTVLMVLLALGIMITIRKSKKR